MYIKIHINLWCQCIYSHYCSCNINIIVAKCHMHGFMHSHMITYVYIDRYGRKNMHTYRYILNRVLAWPEVRGSVWYGLNMVCTFFSFASALDWNSCCCVGRLDMRLTGHDPLEASKLGYSSDFQLSRLSSDFLCRHCFKSMWWIVCSSNVGAMQC